MNFFELVTMEPVGGFYCYYYFSPKGAQNPRSLKLDRNYPDKLRILVEDRDEIPMYLNRISLLEYINRKYLRKAGAFHCGSRVNWEKEEI